MHIESYERVVVGVDPVIPRPPLVVVPVLRVVVVITAVDRAVSGKWARPKHRLAQVRVVPVVAPSVRGVADDLLHRLSLSPTLPVNQHNNKKNGCVVTAIVQPINHWKSVISLVSKMISCTNRTICGSLRCWRLLGKSTSVHTVTE